MKNDEDHHPDAEKSLPHRVTLWRHRKALDPGPMRLGRRPAYPDAAWRKVLRRELTAGTMSVERRQKIAEKNEVGPRTVKRAFDRLLADMSQGEE